MSAAETLGGGGGGKGFRHPNRIHKWVSTGIYCRTKYRVSKCQLGGGKRLCVTKSYGTVTVLTLTHTVKNQ